MEKIDDYVKRSEVLALEKEVYVKEVDYRIRCIDASAVESLEGYVLTAETEAEIRKAVRVIIREAKRLTDAIIQNLSKLEERKNGKWIPCSDRLPEEEVQVLVTDDAGGLATIDVDCGYFDKEYGRFEWFHSQNVTAWMPLPGPWKGEEDGMDC